MTFINKTAKTTVEEMLAAVPVHNEKGYAMAPWQLQLYLANAKVQIVTAASIDKRGACRSVGSGHERFPLCGRNTDISRATTWRGR